MALTKVDTQLLSNGITTDSTGLNTITNGNTKILSSVAGTDRKLIFQNEVGTQATLAMGTTGSAGGLNTFYVQTNAGYSLTVDANGYVKTPYRPTFNAYKNYGTPTTATMGSITGIVFDGTWINTASGYSTSTGRFTAPVAGTYCFSVNIEIALMGPNHFVRHPQIFIYKNGAALTEKPCSVGPTSSTLTGSAFQHYGTGQFYIVSANANDYFEVKYSFSSDADTMYFYQEQNFQGFLLN